MTMVQPMLAREDPPQLGGEGEPLGLEPFESLKVARLGAERLAYAQ